MPWPSAGGRPTPLPQTHAHTLPLHPLQPMHHPQLGHIHSQRLYPAVQPQQTVGHQCCETSLTTKALKGKPPVLNSSDPPPPAPPPSPPAPPPSRLPPAHLPRLLSANCRRSAAPFKVAHHMMHQRKVRMGAGHPFPTAVTPPPPPHHLQPSRRRHSPPQVAPSSSAPTVRLVISAVKSPIWKARCMKG
jgi:hypothetical protein